MASANEVGGGDATVDNQSVFRIPDYTPTELSIDISTEQNGLLYKEIKQEGEGDEKPGRGSKVFVRYVGRLSDGTVFDKNVAPSSPFSFELGEGKVIKGWDIGIATMKKGEEATLIIHYTLAYGDKGSGQIPPMATLFFDVTLLEWQEEDLSPDKKGGITRKILSEGEMKYLKPNDGANVEVDLEGSFDGKVFDKRQITFDLGEGSEANVCRGVEIALEKFAKGDVAVLKIKSEYAFGATGNEAFGVPPDATVSYRVHLLNFKKLTEVWNLNGSEKLDYSKRFKEKGTKYFEQAKYSLAVAQYKKIVDYLKAEALLKGEEEETRKSLLCASYLNQSICWLKLLDYVKARNCAESALELQPNNAKAYFRKGMAYLMTKDYDIAVEDFQKVLQLEPDNKAAQQQLYTAKAKQKEQLEVSKRLYSKMFKYESGVHL